MSLHYCRSKSNQQLGVVSLWRPNRKKFRSKHLRFLLLMMICIGDDRVTGLRTQDKWVNLDNLCRSYPDKKMIYMDWEHSLRLAYEERPSHQIECQIELRLPSEKLGFFVLIEELKLECDSDFVQFGR